MSVTFLRYKILNGPTPDKIISAFDEECQKQLEIMYMSRVIPQVELVKIAVYNTVEEKEKIFREEIELQQREGLLPEVSE